MLLSMKRIAILAILLLCAVSLQAQNEEAFKAFGERYQNRENYGVAVLGRAGIKMAGLLGDKQSRELMKQLDIVVSVNCSPDEDGTLKADFDRLTEEYEPVVDTLIDGDQVCVWIDRGLTAVAFYMTNAEMKNVTLFSGKELDFKSLIPMEVEE